MLSIINPTNMAMNLPCCVYAPYCAHSSQRQLQSQNLPSLVLDSAGDNIPWSGRLPTQQHQSSYSFDRPSHVPLFPSQTLSYLNNQDKLRSRASTYSATSQAASWATPTYPMLSNDFMNSTWLPARTKDAYSNSGASAFTNEQNDYTPGMKYEQLELRDVSPSRGTDFSTVSASSQASPAPASNFMDYNSFRTQRDGSPFLSSQPLAPEQLRAAGCDSRRMSTASFDSEMTSQNSKPRSRQGSEAVHCHVCQKTFDRRSNFKSHWETHDKDRQRTTCKVVGCNKTFGRPAEMTRHVNSAHRQKSFPCGSCGKEFTRHDILLRHCKDACPVLVKGKGNGKKRRSKGS